MSEIIAKAKERMEKSIESTKQKFSSIRTGRANTSLVEHLNVVAYGASMSLNQLGTITVPETQMLMISPFDPQNIAVIEKAIMNSNLGLTPQNDGKVIRIPLPQLSEERRKDLEKIVKNEAEEGRVVIRNIRRDLIDEVKKDETLSEDDSKRIQDDIQKTTDDFNARIEDLLANKLKEVHEI
jgi:ribosome recycling factor